MQKKRHDTAQPPNNADLSASFKRNQEYQKSLDAHICSLIEY